MIKKYLQPARQTKEQMCRIPFSENALRTSQIDSGNIFHIKYLKMKF